MDEEARAIGIWDSVKDWWGGKKPSEPVDELSKIGVYTISSQELKVRMARYKNLIDEYQKPISTKEVVEHGVKRKVRLAPTERLEKWKERLEVTKVAMEVIAVPYLRTMDAQNALYGQALKAYEQLFDYAMSYGEDLSEIFAAQNVANKDEVMGGYEFFCQNYIKTWAFILISWSFGAQDVSPSYSVTVHAVAPQARGPETRPASIDLDKLAEEANK